MRNAEESTDPKLQRVVDLLFNIIETNEDHFKTEIYYLLVSYVMHLRECNECRAIAAVSQELLDEFYEAFEDAKIDIPFATISHPRNRGRRKE